MATSIHRWIPFAMAFMGVLGGVLAFGVAGMFIGPALLALAINLGKQLAPSAAVPVVET